jgi:thioredoxin reductase (NADPH)
MYDIVIIGAGPAGMTAAIYALRADKKVLLLEKETFGGQITYSPRVENYPTQLAISGNELAQMMLDQVMEHGAEIELAEVTGVSKTDGGYSVETDNGTFFGKTVIIATGSKHRQLGLEGENELVGEGVSYCAVCDGAFYNGKKVAVIGGGNTALQDAVLLSDICTEVTVVQNLAQMTGESKLVSKLEAKSNVKFIFNTVVKELVGNDTGLTAIKLFNTKSEESSTLEVDGIFVAIGQKPENEAFKELTKLNDYGYIVSDENCLTDSEGIFVAGDCRTKSVRQITTATADGAVAALAACRFLDNN